MGGTTCYYKTQQRVGPDAVLQNGSENEIRFPYRNITGSVTTCSYISPTVSETRYYYRSTTRDENWCCCIKSTVSETRYYYRSTSGSET